MMRLRAAVVRAARRFGPALMVALSAVALTVGTAVYSDDPGWPHQNGRRLFWEDLITQGKLVDPLSRVYREMGSDPTLQAPISPELLMMRHYSSFSASLPVPRGETHRTAFLNPTTLAEVEAIYTETLSRVGLTRDSTFDRVVESPVVRYPGYRPDPRETRQPYVRTNLLVWRYIDRWGDDDLTFTVVFDVVSSGYPDRSYRFLSVQEPQRTRQ